MKHQKLYLYATVSVMIFTLLVSLISIPYLVRANSTDFLSSTISSSKAQAEQLAIMSIEKDDGSLNAKAKIKKIVLLQEVIKNTETNLTFLSVLDWSGRILCYPNVTKVGEVVNTTHSTAKSIEDSELGEQLYDKINSKEFLQSERKNQIIYLQSVKGTDFIIAAHLNIDGFKVLENTWKRQYYVFALILTLLITVFILIAIRIISSYYQNIIEEKNLKFEDGVLSLSKLNASLESYQNKLSEISLKEENNQVVKEDVYSIEEKEKKRILTYIRNELVPISMNDIAYVYVENTITYIMRKDGKRSTSNDSLDQIFANLNSTSFFRVNRQIIVAISAIEKIIKFGNSQLKIQVIPPSEIDFIIGKNKAAAFKQWLDM